MYILMYAELVWSNSNTKIAKIEIKEKAVNAYETKRPFENRNATIKSFLFFLSLFGFKLSVSSISLESGCFLRMAVSVSPLSELCLVVSVASVGSFSIWMPSDVLCLKIKSGFICFFMLACIFEYSTNRSQSGYV